MSHVHGKRLGNRGAVVWWLGWHPLITPLIGAVVGLTVSNALAIPGQLLLGIDVLVTMAVGVVAGALAGGLVWYRGTRFVNHEYGTVLDSLTPPDGANREEGPTFLLVGPGAGSRPLVEPGRRYEASVLRLGPDAVEIQRGTFDLADRRVRLDGEALALPYGLIERVDYDGSELVLVTTRDDRFTAPVRAAPTDLLRTLRTRTDG